MDDRMDISNGMEYRFSSDLRAFPPFHLLSGMAALGHIAVERSVLETWLGGRYKSVLKSQLQKGTIREAKNGTKSDLFLCEVIAKSFRNQLKPELSRCEWIQNLCESITKFLERDAMSSKREKPLASASQDEISSERLVALAQLFFNILMHSEHKTHESVSLCIKYLTRVVSENIDYEFRHEMDIEKPLDLCFAAACFHEISDNRKLDAYCLKITALCKSLHRICHRNNRILDETIAQIYACMENAEQILSKMSETERTQNGYRLCLPLIEMVCYDNPGGLKTHTDRVMQLCDTFSDYFEKIALPKERTNELWSKYNCFRAIVEENSVFDSSELAGRWTYRSIFDSDKSFDELATEINQGILGECDPPENEQLSDLLERHELMTDYMERLRFTNATEELLEIATEIATDPQLASAFKLSLLVPKISVLGFEPDPSQALYCKALREMDAESLYHEGYARFASPGEQKRAEDAYWEETRRCGADKENQKKARLLLNIIETIEHNGPEYKRRIAIQSLTLASCMDDTKAMERAIDKFYAIVLGDLGTAIEHEEIERRYNGLLQLGKKECANRFVTRGIALLDAEYTKSENTENNLYLLCHILMNLAECAGDARCLEHYRERQREVLGLGFRIRS